MREIIQEEVSESNQIELIKKNLVMSGVPESVRANEDLQKAKDIIKNHLNIGALIEKVERCGKNKPQDPNKPRLLKLFMITKDNRHTILQNATKLREATDDYVKAKIYISPDQTKKQQLEGKNLRDNLRAMRRENPEKTYKINKGVIIEVEPVQE